jgi:hypothetical protein
MMLTSPVLSLSNISASDVWAMAGRGERDSLASLQQNETHHRLQQIYRQ